MKRFLIAASLAALNFAAFALPSIASVQTEISQGHYTQAETMMREVVAAKPGSAKAHYIYAEILAHERRFDLAAEEAASAKRLDPQLKFTQPEKFNTFSQLLEREQANARRVSTPERSAAPAQARRESLESPANNGGGGGMPGWVWGLGGAGLAFVAWRMFSASQQTGSAGNSTPTGAGGMRAMNVGGGLPSNNGYAPAPAPGPAPSYGQPAYAPQAAAPSSGLLGTGLAVAGGLAAGMMVEKLFEGHRDTGAGGFGSLGGNSAPTLRDTSPGLFEAQPDSAARELEQRPIDMGTGDDWDSGSSAASDDSGSSSGSDDW